MEGASAVEPRISRSGYTNDLKIILPAALRCRISARTGLPGVNTL